VRSCPRRVRLAAAGGPPAVAPRPVPAPAPVLSVVVPTHNNAAVLGRCLDSWQHFASDQPVEILVIADGCTDGTHGLLDGVRRSPWGARAVRLFEEQDVHELRCDNRGFREASGSLLLAWQDDMFLRARWLVPELLEAFARYPEIGMLSLIRGLRLLPQVHPLDQWADLQRPEHLQSTLGPSALLSWFRLAEVDAVVRPWVVRRACLDAVGLLDEGFVPTEWDEADLAYRIRRSEWAVATHGYERAGAFTHLGSSTLGFGLSEAYKARALANGRLFRSRWEPTIREDLSRPRRTWRRPVRAAAVPRMLLRGAAAAAGKLWRS